MISAVACGSPDLMAGKEMNAERGCPSRRSAVIRAGSVRPVSVLIQTFAPVTPSG
jgi:hypothetical protein